MSKASTLIILSLALFLVLIISASIGAFKIPISAIFTNNLNEQQELVLTSIRLPRLFLAMFVGAALAMCGAVMQSLFRNPLADPGLIGISSSAALFVAFTIVVFGSVINAFGVYSLIFSAFIGAFFSCLIIFYFVKLSGSFSVTYMLLIGIAINAIANAATGFLAYFSNDQQLRALTIWAMGNLSGALWSFVFACFLIIIPILFIFIKNASALNIFLLGEDEAKNLGVDVLRLKKTMIICISLAIGLCVALSGIIVFIGLVVPHLARIMFGANNRFLIPASAFLGAILLIFADTISRIIVMPAEMPVGIITSLIGGPFFLWLLIKEYSRK